MRITGQLRKWNSWFDEHEILHSASAIAFQALFAIVPLALFVLALLGFTDLGRVWEDAAAEIQPKLSDDAFAVVDDTARRVLEDQQPFWLTIGAALAIWRLSAAMRATIGALDTIYEVDENRPLVQRLKLSIALSLATTALMLAALAVLYLGPLVVPTDSTVPEILSILVRWTIALALGLTAVGILVHFAPATPAPTSWVSRGSLLCAAAWLVATLAFAFYASELADYGSVFGSFATLFLLLTYLYLSATAFLVGAELDVRSGAQDPKARRARRSAGPVVPASVEPGG
ncbi:MAG TPA: YihY/virulence factor BrkB family protein [Solirubrobacteraceae bacterium]|jgi:membrane protein